MWPVSAAFRSALADSHVVATLAQITDASAEVLATLRLTAGGVTIDETRAVRRQCTVSLTDNTGTLVPADASSLLHPLSGNELRLYRGIQLPTGAELAPLGVFRLSKPVIKDTPAGLAIDAQGFDRARVIQRASYTAPVVIAAGTPGPAAIQTLLSGGWPAGAQPLTFSLAPSTYTTPLLVFGLDATSDRWADAASIAAGMGQELLFDPVGVVISRAIVDPTLVASSLTWVEGPTCTMLDLERDLDDEDTYNGVVYNISNPDLAAPIHSEAWDTTPGSPTYYLGDYGKRPLIVNNSTISSQAQADAATAAQLLTVLGATETVSVTTIPDPTVDAGDVATISRGRAKVNAPYALRTASIPLAASGTMSVTCRPKRTAA